MGITVGCMANSMHVLPIVSDAVPSGPSQWTMTGGQWRMTHGQQTMTQGRWTRVQWAMTQESADNDQVNK